MEHRMHLRVARQTQNLKQVTRFYTCVLGFKQLGDFTDHDGYNGVMLGFENHPWHLEFTINGEKVEHQFDANDLLVLYPTRMET